MNIGIKTLLLSCMILYGVSVQSQQVAVKTNLFYDIAAYTMNAGIEFGLAPRWTLDVSANYNGWTLSHERKWKHWFIQPEARYWFCDRFAGHFLGIHAHGGKYNIGGLKNDVSFLGTDFSKFSDQRYQGWFVGAGVAYGYAWILGKHWNLEAELGLGYAYSRFDVYPCAQCGKEIARDKSHHYVGPTKAAINLVYTF